MTGDYYKWEITLNVQGSFISGNWKKNVTKWCLHKKGCLKLIRSFFTWHTKSFTDKSFTSFKSYSCPNFNTKAMPNLGLNLLKPGSFSGIIPKTSQTKFHQIGITKSKVIRVQILAPKCEKQKMVWNT